MSTGNAANQLNVWMPLPWADGKPPEWAAALLPALSRLDVTVHVTRLPRLASWASWRHQMPPGTNVIHVDRAVPPALVPDGWPIVVTLGWPASGAWPKVQSRLWRWWYAAGVPALGHAVPPAATIVVAPSSAMVLSSPLRPGSAASWVIPCLSGCLPELQRIVCQRSVSTRYLVCLGS